MLLKCCTEYVSKPGKPSNGHRTRSTVIPILKKGSTKECSNHRTIALIYHVSEIMLKILQARLQPLHEQGLPDIQTLGLEKGRKNQKSNCQHLVNHRESKRNQEKHLALSLTMLKPLTVWIINCGNLLKRWKPLKGMETPNHLCFLINLYSGHEATVRTLYGTTYLFGV